jgi:general secretion pathway protein G
MFKKGFTLVELLVVITIIAILSVAAYVAVGGQTTKAKNSRRMQDLSTIQSALEIYFAEMGRYPDAETIPSPPHGNFKTYETDQLTTKYISKQPLDPWGMPYAYNTNVTNKQYQLAATLEEEDVYKAYVIGNGTNLIKDKDGDTVTDGDTTDLPYEEPAP